MRAEEGAPPEHEVLALHAEPQSGVPAASLLGEVVHVEGRLLKHVPEAPLHLDAVLGDVHCEEGVLGDRALQSMIKPKVEFDGVLADHEGAVHADQRVLPHAVPAKQRCASNDGPQQQAASSPRRCAGSEGSRKVLQRELAEVVAHSDRVCERAQRRLDRSGVVHDHITHRR